MGVGWVSVVGSSSFETVFVFLCAALIALFWFVRKVPFVSYTFVLSVLFVCVGVGMVRMDIAHMRDNASDLDAYVSQTVSALGVITRDVDVRERTQHLFVTLEKIDEHTLEEEAVLVITEAFAKYRYGDRIAVSGTLSVPETFVTDLGRTFDYPGYLEAQGVSHTFFFPDEVSVISHNEGNIIMRYLLALKHAFMESVERLIPEPSAGLGEGLVLGVKRAIGDDLEEIFRRVGIIHIVVLSGYNVTIVAEAIMRLLSVFFAPRIRALCGVVAIAAFAIVAGLSATVLRASLMAGLVLLARATGRTYAVLRGLFLAGVVMLIWNPYLLVYDPGFQLSFLATIGLIVLAPLIEQYFALVPTRLQIREFVVATIATQIFVLPLLLYSIGEFSTVAVLANVLVLPAVPLAMLLVFGTGVLGFVSNILALPFAYSGHIVLTYIVEIATHLASLPFASFVVPAFPFWGVVLAYGVLGMLMLWGSRRRSSTPSPRAISLRG